MDEVVGGLEPGRNGGRGGPVFKADMASLLTAAAGSGVAAWTLPGDDLRTPKRIRDLASGLVLELDCRVCDDVRTIVSELVTNACRHSRSARPGGRVAVSVAVSAGRVAITVADEGSDDELGPRVKPAGCGEGGMGLGICQALGDLQITGDADSGWCVSLRLAA